MLVSAAIHDGAVSVYKFIDDYSVMELTTLFALALLTIYRKKLSSNHEYRESSPSTPRSNKHKRAVVVSESKRGSASFPNISIDVMVNIVSYMTNHEIACIMSTSKKMYKEISSDAVWEQLWLQTYGSMWQHPEIRKIREGRGIFWDPLLNYGPPQQGWYRFFLLFEVSYTDWILAGYCTHARCLVGINNSIVDATHFIDAHPGSSETLTESAGCDASETFAEIGHSKHAEKVMSSLKVWDSSSNNVPVCLCNDAHLQLDQCEHCLQTSRNAASARKRGGSRRVAVELPHQMRKFPARTKLHEHMKVNQKKVTELATSKHKQACSDAITAETGGGTGGVNLGMGMTMGVTMGVGDMQLPALSSVLPMLEAAVSENVPPLSLLTGSVDSYDYEAFDAYDSDSADTDTDSLSDGESSVSISSGSSGVYSDDVGEGVIDTDGIPDVAQHITMFSPAKALTSILDKIKREYRKGSLQLRGVSGSSRSRYGSRSGVGGGGGGGGGSYREREEGEDFEGEGEGYVPPIASYFGPSQRMVPQLGGFQPCLLPQDHTGQPKAFFDPFTEEWTAWWSCCGQGHVLVEAPMPPPDPVRDAIFCK